MVGSRVGMCVGLLLGEWSSVFILDPRPSGGPPRGSCAGCVCGCSCGCVFGLVCGVVCECGFASMLAPAWAVACTLSELHAAVLLLILLV